MKQCLARAWLGGKRVEQGSVLSIDKFQPIPYLWVNTTFLALPASNVFQTALRPKTQPLTLTLQTPLAENVPSGLPRTCVRVTER
jgi:hypothetical protein